MLACMSERHRMGDMRQLITSSLPRRGPMKLGLASRAVDVVVNHMRVDLDHAAGRGLAH